MRSPSPDSARPAEPGRATAIFRTFGRARARRAHQGVALSSRYPMEMRRSDFALDEIQEAVRDTFSSLLQKHCPISVVRAAEPLGLDEKLWSQLGEARTVAMGVPESAGGDGAGLSELAVVGELIGLHLAPVPFVETAVAARLLAADARGAGADALADALDGRR